jgi:hypothetical protein
MWRWSFSLFVVFYLSISSISAAVCESVLDQLAIASFFVEAERIPEDIPLQPGETAEYLGKGATGTVFLVHSFEAQSYALKKI